MARSVCEVAHGGQVVCSQVTAELLRDDLAEGIELVDLGRLFSKDGGLAVLFGNLANAYWNLGDYNTARPLNARALAIQEKVLGSDEAMRSANVKRGELRTIGSTYNLQEVTFRK